jgi:hypothetical protein
MIMHRRWSVRGSAVALLSAVLPGGQSGCAQRSGAPSPPVLRDFISADAARQVEREVKRSPRDAITLVAVRGDWEEFFIRRWSIDDGTLICEELDSSASPLPTEGGTQAAASWITTCTTSDEAVVAAVRNVRTMLKQESANGWFPEPDPGLDSWLVLNSGQTWLPLRDVDMAALGETQGDLRSLVSLDRDAFDAEFSRSFGNISTARETIRDWVWVLNANVGAGRVEVASEILLALTSACKLLQMPERGGRAPSMMPGSPDRAAPVSVPSAESVVDLCDLVPDEATSEMHYAREVTINTSTSLTAQLHVTSKGNGLLTLGNLSLKVFDQHLDGKIFRGGLLNCRLSDLNGDGSKDLVIFGPAVMTPVADDHPAQAERAEDVLMIFLFDPEHQRFEPALLAGADGLVFQQ